MTPSGSAQSVDDAAALFAETARRYSQFVEAAAGIDDDERLRRARLHLVELVHAAGQLPSGDPDGPDIDQEVSGPADWPGFGEIDVYHEVFDPYVDEPPVCGSLSDDMLDIYTDLRRGLLHYDAGQIASAVWEWKFHFDYHWGDHAVDALRALHRACVRRARQ